MTQSAAVRSDDLINSFGVATHINYTDGQYRDVSADVSALGYLGLDHVRDAAPNPGFDPVGQIHLGLAADAGIKFTFIANDDPLLTVQRIHDFVVAHPGSVVGIEGPNEVNNWPVTYNNQSGTAGAQAYQQALFNAVNADPLLKDIPVLGFTDFPFHASASDWNNVHPYPKNGDQPLANITYNVNGQAAVDPGKPFAITELGYHTSLTADTAGGWEGVNEATQAKLLLNALMDAASLGSRSTSIYQLLDAYADPQGSNQEDHFGLFRLDGTSKPAADAIHNLTSIMADAGSNASSFSASTLNYSISGLPSTGHSYLTQKSDGSFQIIAWSEPDIWNETTDTPISVASAPVNINLGQTFGTVQVFDPMLGTAATQTLHNVSSVSLGLTDHPLVIQVSNDTSAPGSSAPGVSNPGASVTQPQVGAGQSAGTNDASSVSGSNFVGGPSADTLITSVTAGTGSSPAHIQLTALQTDNNGAFQRMVDLGHLGTEWSIDGAADFNRDGYSDILIHSPSGSGTNTYAVLFTGPNGTQSVSTLGNVGTEQHVIGYGDVNGDGTPDIVFGSNSSVGSTANTQKLTVLNMSNGQVSGGQTLASIAGNQTVDAIADFNHDGMADILKHYDSGGQHYFQIANGTGSGFQAPVDVGHVGNDWQVVGTGDFNADGTSDILITRLTATSRDIAIMTVQNSKIVAVTNAGTLGLETQIDGIGDFNGDGTSDIAFHQSLNGHIIPWQMTIQNNHVTDAHQVGSLGSEWMIS